jgi:predicted RNA-binding Zn ribbon-like protein
VRGAPALELLQSRLPGGADLLDDPEWLHAAVRRWEVDPGNDASPADVRTLRSLRETMRDVVAILDGGRLPTDAELDALNEFLAATPVRARLGRHGDVLLVDMVPVADGWALVVRDVAGWFASLLRADPWRLKLCASPECRLPFYDASKSRTRRWHDDATCGNRDRVRRFRERKATGDIAGRTT